jgi:hypothetical protein
MILHCASETTSGLSEWSMSLSTSLGSVTSARGADPNQSNSDKILTRPRLDVLGSAATDANSWRNSPRDGLCRLSASSPGGVPRLQATLSEFSRIRSLPIFLPWHCAVPFSATATRSHEYTAPPDSYRYCGLTGLLACYRHLAEGTLIRSISAHSPGSGRRSWFQRSRRRLPTQRSAKKPVPPPLNRSGGE